MRGSEQNIVTGCWDVDCMMCSGEACNLCGAGCWSNRKDCDHDVIDRHAEPEGTSMSDVLTREEILASGVDKEAACHQDMRERQLLKCPKCDRTFKTQGALNGHQRSHSFFSFLATLPNPEERRKEREELNIRIVVAAVHHYTVNQRPAKLLGAAPHCDVCAVVSEIDEVLARDLALWFQDESLAAVNVPE